MTMRRLPVAIVRTAYAFPGRDELGRLCRGLLVVVGERLHGAQVQVFRRMAAALAVSELESALTGVASAET